MLEQVGVESEQALVERLAAFTQLMAELDNALVRLRQSELEPKLADARDKVARCDGLRQAATMAGNRLAQHRQLAQVRQALSGLVEVDREADGQLQAAEARLSEAKQKLQDLERARTEGQAAVFAASLVEGESCPVCGSAHHPQPAIAGAAIPVPTDIDAADDEMDAAESAVTKARESKQAVKQEIALAEQSQSNLIEALGEAGNWALEQLREAANKAQQDLRVEESAQQAITRMELADSNYASQQVEREGKLATASRELSRCRSEVAAAEAALDARTAKVPEPWRKPGAVDEAIGQASRKLEELKQALKYAQDHHLQALREQSMAETSLTMSKHAKEDPRAGTEGADRRAA